MCRKWGAGGRGERGQGIPLWLTTHTSNRASAWYCVDKQFVRSHTAACACRPTGVMLVASCQCPDLTGPDVPYSQRCHQCYGGFRVLPNWHRDRCVGGADPGPAWRVMSQQAISSIDWIARGLYSCCAFYCGCVVWLQVGHQLVAAYATCTGLPLYRRRIQGHSRSQVRLLWGVSAGDAIASFQTAVLATHAGNQAWLSQAVSHWI